MKKMLCILHIFLLLMMAPSISFAAPLSFNIPLDSYLYTYLDKLEGLGYLDE